MKLFSKNVAGRCITLEACTEFLFGLSYSRLAGSWWSFHFGPLGLHIRKACSHGRALCRECHLGEK